MSLFMLILQYWKVLLYRLIFNISILGILFRTLCFLIPKMHWEKVHKIMSDQCTSHWFCCINICASSCGPLKRSPLEKKYNVCKNYDTKKINKNKRIQRKINAYVNIKTDSLQDLIWKPTCMKLNMINYEYYQTMHMHNW